MSFFSQFTHEREEKKRKQKEALEDQVLLSEDVRKFFATDLGKYLKAKMESDRTTILKALQAANPFDPQAIMALQSKYSAIGNLSNYLAQAIIAGDQAYTTLAQQDGRDTA